MNEARQGLGQYLPKSYESLVGELLKNDIRTQWQNGLGMAVEMLQHAGEISASAAQRYQQGIEMWFRHPDHGFQHSVRVYGGMLWLAKESLIAGINDRQLQAHALLHDLLQSIPLIDPQTDEELPYNARKKHQQLIAYTVKRFGPVLGLSVDEITELAYGLRVHDDVYDGVIHQDLPVTCQLLSDSDKLFGAGDSFEPKELALSLIHRNLTSFSQPNGWYLVRDLAHTQREEWKYGDRWLGDRITPVLNEVFNMPFYTDMGKAVADSRRKEFVNHAPHTYLEYYQRTIDDVHWWMASRDEASVELIGMEQEPWRQDNVSINRIIATAYSTALLLPDKYLRKGLTPYGWHVKVTIGNKIRVIDPSVARFAFNEGGDYNSESGAEKFIHTINQVIREYI